MSSVRRTTVGTTLLVVLLLRDMMASSARDVAVSDYYGTVHRRDSQRGRCVSLPANMTLCRGVGYDQVRLPNLFGHETLGEAAEQANSWMLLVNIHCHPDTQIFLCSLFAPVCLGLNEPIYPCRSLCDAVKAGCEDRMLSYGYPWPDLLRCDQYPANTNVCIRPRATSTAGTVRPCPACSQPATYEGIMDGYCNAEFVIKVTVTQAVVSGPHLKVITSRKRKFYKIIPLLKRRELRRSNLYVLNGASCDCSGVERTMTDDGAVTSRGHLLVMGRRQDNRYVITHAMPFDRRSGELRRAMRTMRRRADTACGMQARSRSRPSIARDGFSL